MKTATLEDFRSNLKERLQEVEDDQDILILSCPKKRAFVVLTLEQFNSMEETTHLMSTPANTERLLESISQDRSGNITVMERDLGDKPLRSSKAKLAVAARKKR